MSGHRETGRVAGCVPRAPRASPSAQRPGWPHPCRAWPRRPILPVERGSTGGRALRRNPPASGGARSRIAWASSDPRRVRPVVVRGGVDRPPPVAEGAAAEPLGSGRAVTGVSPPDPRAAGDGWQLFSPVRRPERWVGLPEAAPAAPARSRGRRSVRLRQTVKSLGFPRLPCYVWALAFQPAHVAPEETRSEDDEARA